MELEIFENARNRRRQLVQRTHSFNSIGTKTRENYVWERDEYTSNCSGCQCEFTFFVRKHHCRACGKIFCRSCSGFRVDVNKQIKQIMRFPVLEIDDSSCEKEETVRVCIPCLKRVNNVVGAFKYIQIFTRGQ